MPPKSTPWRRLFYPEGFELTLKSCIIVFFDTNLSDVPSENNVQHVLLFLFLLSPFFSFSE